MGQKHKIRTCYGSHFWEIEQVLLLSGFNLIGLNILKRLLNHKCGLSYEAVERIVTEAVGSLKEVDNAKMFYFPSR